MKRTIWLFLTHLIFACNAAKADDCAAFKTDPTSEFAGFERVDLIECRALTNASRNGGRPLTLHQLIQAKAESPYDDGRNTIWGRVKARGLDFRIDCMATTGTYSMCHCLSERLPMTVGFADYVRVITPSSRATAASLGLSEGDFATLSGILWSVRDQCVAGR